MALGLYDLDLLRKGLLWFLVGFLSFMGGFYLLFSGPHIAFLLGVGLLIVAAWLGVSVSWSEDEDKREIRAYSKLVAVAGMSLILAWTIFIVHMICNSCG